MSIEYKAYRLEDGEVVLVQEGSDAELDILSNGGAWSVAVPGMNGATSDDGAVPELPTSASPSTSLIETSGRIYCQTNNRWITDSDDNYGRQYYQWAEQAGTGVNPIAEWEHMGLLMPKGKKLRKLLIMARANNAQVTDFEISIMVRIPTPITRYKTGIDADSEMENIEVFRGNFVELGMTGNMQDRRLKEIDLGDYEIPENAQVSMYFKPIGALTGRRYILFHSVLEII